MTPKAVFVWILLAGFSIFAPGASVAQGLDATVSTVAGSGEAGFRDGSRDTARFDWPTDVAVAADWTLYVTDFGNNRIRRIDPDGEVTTLAGSGEAGFADGLGEAAAFYGPNALVIGPDDNLYVADAGNARIRMVTPAGEVITVAGNGERGHRDGPGNIARFAYPTGLAFDPEGHLYVVDRWAHMVRRIDPSGTVHTVAGNGRPGFVDGHGSAARFDNPLGAWWDDRWGLVVTDSGNNALRRVSPDGEVGTVVGGPFASAQDGPKEDAGFAWNTGVVGDGRGGFFITDAHNHRIRRVGRDFSVSTVAGSGDDVFRDGPGPEAAFVFITGIARDPAGNLLVADSGAHRIRRVVLAVSGLAWRFPLDVARPPS
ncbi:MAG: NHL repeat-containing protein [Leptospirillia bacterium]